MLIIILILWFKTWIFGNNVIKQEQRHVLMQGIKNDNWHKSEAQQIKKHC